MLNQVVLVGRLVKDPTLYKTESGKKITTVTLAVPRSFKNINGEYDTDFIDCTLWTTIASSTVEYCHTGDLLGIKGRLQTRKIEQEEQTSYKMEVVAEKVTFLSTNKKEG